MTTKDEALIELIEDLLEQIERVDDHGPRKKLVQRGIAAITAIKQAITSGNGQAQEPVDKDQWWYKELEGFWGNSAHTVTFDTRRAALVALETLASTNALVREPAPKQSEPEGYKLVPVEPTKEMCAAAVKFANGDAVYKNVAAAALEIEEGIYGEAYRAMLAAAPTPPEAK